MDGHILREKNILIENLQNSEQRVILNFIQRNDQFVIDFLGKYNIYINSTDIITIGVKLYQLHDNTSIYIRVMQISPMYMGQREIYRIISDMEYDDKISILDRIKQIKDSYFHK